MDQAFEFVKDNKGIAPELNYKYTEIVGKCNPTQGSNLMPLKGFTVLESRKEKDLEALVAKRVVSVYLDAFGLMHYSKGIFSGPCTTSLNHAMVIVGYDQEEVLIEKKKTMVKYWVLKNSWSEAWGENGYAWISDSHIKDRWMGGFRLKEI